MLKIPYYSSYNGEKKIALLDNSAVEFMLQLDNRGHHPDTLLRGYDVVFLPGWVVEELQDSSFRVKYIERLADTGIPIRIIEEGHYKGLMNGREIFLYDIVKAAVSKVGDFIKYLHMNVEKDDPFDMGPYEDWIREMYENWPLSGGLTAGGRERKKNAGEISLTVLAEIFSWYYLDTESLTVYTQDSDAYDFQRNAEEQLKKKDNLKDTIPVSVTYRSNDSILYQMYRDSQLTIEDVEDIRNDARHVTFTQKRADNTVALVSRIVNNEEFIALIQNDSTQIIF
ncbi:MAG: hypothetical protein J1E98_08700 [Lachnospiraceae bacterium]|nr:hypothetical protein [Lachnospiraceae bacterium]